MAVLGDKTTWTQNDLNQFADAFATVAAGAISSTGTGSITLQPGTSGTVKVLAPDQTSTMLQFEDIAATGGKYAGVIIFSGSNGFGPNGRAWSLGVDTAATTPYRDWFQSRVNTDGSVSDPDGMYISANGGTSANPASFGFGYSQPAQTFRVRVMPGGGDLTQGALAIHSNVSQTGRPFVIFANGTGETSPQIYVNSDYSTWIKSGATNLVVTDGVLNNTTTVTSATAAFTSADLGRYISGAGIPGGSFISTINSATSVLISQAATATGGGVTLTIDHPLFEVVTNGNSPLFCVHPGSGAGAVNMPVGVVGIGPGVAPLPTATLDIVQISSATASVKVRTATNGSLAINALGAFAEVDLWTANASVLVLGSNATQAMKITTAQSVLIGHTAIATTATDGFAYITSTAGAPTGVPTTQSGFAAIHYDTTNHKFWVYDAGWKGVVVA